MKRITTNKKSIVINIKYETRMRVICVALGLVYGAWIVAMFTT